ncbi:hypothetical protein LX73_2337 [Fodinibius salinus]|uniref:Uncharacterized protein n=1 Tax=Fodinibius salinus TaxID=860790 RepID=A0A5D3YIM2_9BACT|nr:hypothetical protein [Fodinibius salinus]TYP92090.1 hypothetical protein LX73_2337 [Fodinibius salinus]
MKKGTIPLRNSLIRPNLPFGAGSGSQSADLTITQEDSYGDGWNGAVMTIEDSDGNEVYSGEVESGSKDTDIITLECGDYTVNVTSGNYPSEISWKIDNTEGTILAGGAPSNKTFNPCTAKADNEGPIPKDSSGTINKDVVVNNPTSTSLDITFQAAEDDNPPISYTLYGSNSNNICASISDAESNGEFITSYNDINSEKTYTENNLNPNQQRYYTVIAEDNFGNKTLYNCGNDTTLADTSAPSARGPFFGQRTQGDFQNAVRFIKPDGSGGYERQAFTFYQTGPNASDSIDAILDGDRNISVRVGKDNVTGTIDLVYEFYISDSPQLTPADVENNSELIATLTDQGGLPLDEVEAVHGPFTLRSLNTVAESKNNYYFNTIVKDEAGNKGLYNTGILCSKWVYRQDINFISVTSSSFDIQLGIDQCLTNVSFPFTPNVELYYSTQNNIWGSASRIRQNGINVYDGPTNYEFTDYNSKSATTDGNAYDVFNGKYTGLQSDTLYYLSFIVSDPVGNELIGYPVAVKTLS